MQTKSLQLVALIAAIVVHLGCAGSKESGDEERSRGPRARTQSPSFVELDLAAAEGSVRTIQLYRTGQEEELPVIELDRRGTPSSSETLTLEFDVLAERGRSLSAYFYHADRVWRRDLSPGEFLESFQHDNLLDYKISSGTQVPYVHYQYTFPNNSIQFLISGNYIVRVTEQGREEEVLLERAFFVTEQATDLQFATDQVLVGNYGFPSTQPIAQFRPPTGTEGNVFDYNVCFVRNGRFDLARCSERPSLMNAPVMEFYLEPEMSFEPEDAAHYLDITNLRSVDRITSSDFAVSPYRIVIEPDYARFGGSGPLLNGQSRISSTLGDADTRAEYVLTRFSYVPPDESRLAGDVLITGSFNGWRYDASNRLQWNAEQKRYEGDVLLKQGEYEYRYVTRDRRTAFTLRSSMPRSDNLYTAFVYFDDVGVGTDRLMAVKQTVVY